ncbi:hypothetical protein [Methanococcoides sp. AM1]|uniref:hypothetical protein n=1 Tax=Methanococcoides sp. AM1 TaxID=1201011 RepID=UPI0010839A05|nr:hypothetical protein [Methanococcoides sp. AM1]
MTELMALKTIKDLNSLAHISEKVSNKMNVEKKNSLRLECMNGFGIHTTHMKVDGRFSKWMNGLTNGTLELPKSKVYDIKTTGFSPFPEVIKDNVYEKEDRCIIDLKPALKFDLFSVEISYRMDDSFLKSLVNTRSSPEPLTDKVKYELSAQLKNPEGLRMAFSEIDIEEFPMTARVHVADRINTNVPDYVKEMVKLESEILNDRNPHSWVKEKQLKHRKVQLQRKLGKGDLLDKVQDLSSLLTPNNFMNYVQIMDDFKLSECERGSEFFRALGSCQLPKFMNVVSRTDLSLEKPASRGTMTYDSKKFGEEIINLFD